MAALRWGFLGAGRHATLRSAPAVHAARGAILQSAAASDPRRAGALKPAGGASGDYTDVLRDPDVDAVYIALANHQHHRWAIAALRAGKPVLCEKPLALDSREAAQMFDAGDRAGVPLVEAAWYRWHPRIVRAQQLVAQAAIGAAREAEVVLSLDSLRLGGSRTDPRTGGGVLYDLGPYACSAVLWSFDWRLPAAVAAVARFGRDGVDVRVEATVRFGGDATPGIGRLYLACGAPDQRVTVRGTTGTLVLTGPVFAPGADARTTIVLQRASAGHRGPIAPGHRRDSGPVRRIRVAPQSACVAMFENVSAAFRGEAGWVVPAEQSVATTALMDAIRAAMAAGR